MYPIKRICLDIDGVLNTMQQTLMQHGGIVGFTDDQYPTDIGFDIVSAINRLSGFQKFTNSSFWNSVPRSLWATCPKSDEYDLILRGAEWLVGKDNIILLTSPTRDPDCCAGKMEWIYAHLPKWLHRQFLMGPTKEFCARPDTLLIDDADKNVNAFTAAGGVGLLVPRPWNSKHVLYAGLAREDHRLAASHYLAGFFAESMQLKGKMNGFGSQVERAPDCSVRPRDPGDVFEQLCGQGLAV